MDGLAEIIKMLEEKLGPKLARSLLYLVALAIAAWAIHTIFEFVVIPLSGPTVTAFNYISGLYLPRFSGASTPITILKIVLTILLFGAILVWAWRSDEKRNLKNKNSVSELFAQMGLTPTTDMMGPISIMQGCINAMIALYSKNKELEKALASRSVEGSTHQ